MGEDGTGTHVVKDEAYKTDELELGAFLLSRGCRVEDAKLRPDGVRSEFIISGKKVFALVKEYEMGSQMTLTPVHPYRNGLAHLRDTCTRLKKARKNL